MKNCFIICLSIGFRISYSKLLYFNHYTETSLCHDSYVLGLPRTSHLSFLSHLKKVKKFSKTLILMVKCISSISLIFTQMFLYVTQTLICPHFVANRERILSLPKHCTHIKVVRPKVKIPRSKRRFEDFNSLNFLVIFLHFIWYCVCLGREREQVPVWLQISSAVQKNFDPKHATSGGLDACSTFIQSQMLTWRECRGGKGADKGTDNPTYS